MKKVFVNGYGSIGSRIIQFINDDPEIEVLGVGKYSPDSKINEAISNGYNVFVPKTKINNFDKFAISGDIETVLNDCDLVIDASPAGSGFKNKINLYEPKNLMAIYHGALENIMGLSICLLIMERMHIIKIL